MSVDWVTQLKNEAECCCCIVYRQSQRLEADGVSESGYLDRRGVWYLLLCSTHMYHLPTPKQVPVKLW